MKAEDKLSEAFYFLEKLRESSKRDLSFNLSAFVQAWRSVFDVLLYDYAEQYFGYPPERTVKITKESFEKIAEVLENLDNPKPKKFIEWYKEKEKTLAKEHFWHLRVFFVHRGGKILEPRLRQKYILEKKPVTYVPINCLRRHNTTICCLQFRRHYTS